MNRFQEYIFYFVFVSLFLFEIPFFNQMWNPIMIYRFIQISIFLLIFVFGKDFKFFNYETKAYLAMMLIGTFLHFFVEIEADPINELINWSLIILLLAIYNYRSFFIQSFPFYLILFFFIVECSIGIYERIVGNYLITYDDTDFLMLSDSSNKTNLSFRSVSLMIHPLKNANTVSIIMSFILVSKNLNKYSKWVLFSLGIGALWAFNSRGSMLCWGLIFIYRFFFYEKKILHSIVSLLAVYILFPYLIEYLSANGFLGRLLSDSIFDDDDVNSRLLAYGWFAMQEWNFETIFFGGKIILMPGSILSLENGVLLNLGYWGWIIGSIKTILEVLISYRALVLYNIREKLIVLFAFWGVGLTNNNTFNHWPLAIFVLSCISFCIFEKKNRIYESII